MKNGSARLLIQQLVDEHMLKATIMLDGHAVWSKERIVRNARRIVKHKTLYNIEAEDYPILSHYFYQFLTQECGSIAHMDIHGWIHKYPDVNHLRDFFKCNEFGKPVREYIPTWRTDARAIVEAVEQQLFPFLTYMANRESK